MKHELRTLLAAVAAGLVIAAAYHAWNSVAATVPGEPFASAAGRIEASEIPVATSVSGRLEEILVHEGQSVRAGQVLARMHVESLLAERDEAQALYRQAVYARSVAHAVTLLRESETRAAEAATRHWKHEFDAVREQLVRALRKPQEDAPSEEELEDHRATARRVAAAASAADAWLAATRVADAVARLQVESARTTVTAAEATIRRVVTQLAESELKAPRDGIVRHRAAKSGEVLDAGNRVVNLVDPADISMHFLLPRAVASRLALGNETRIVLETEPQSVVPGTISFVASAGPLTPAPGTTRERQNGMCRIEVRIDREPLRQRAAQLMTGLSGVAWVKLDPQAAWPPGLALTLEP